MRGATTLVVAGFLLTVPSTQAQDPNVYFGNLHSHTSFSDGSGTPQEAYTRARGVAHLDFFALTEHNHAQAEEGATPDRKDGLLIANDHTLYEGPRDDAVIPAAGRFNQDGQFVALYGEEFSSISKGNHINVFDVPKVIDVPNGSFDQLLQWIGQ